MSLKVKEFKESMKWDSYKVSYTEYTKNYRGAKDLDTQMNKFLKENKINELKDIKYAQINTEYHGYQFPLSSCIIFY